MSEGVRLIEVSQETKGLALSFVLNERIFGTRQLKHDRYVTTLRHGRQTNLLRLFSEK